MVEGDINYYDVDVDVERMGIYIIIIVGDVEADEWSKPVKKRAEMKMMRMKMVELLVSMMMMRLEVEKK